MKKVQSSSQPEAYSQVLAQLETLDRFIAAEAAAKAQNHRPEWDCITGLNRLCGFLGCPRSAVRRLMKSGQLPSYKVNGTWYYLLFEILREINMNEELFRINWNSYEDSEGSPKEMDKIHWKKFLLNDHVLVKYTFQQLTSTLNLPLEMWGKNSKIIKRMIREINRRNVKPLNNTLQ
jgi:hypothetical protein